jgi:iron complex transport system substrate-binding protein
MKITMTWCLLASLLVGTASAMEDRGCVDSVAADADLFSDKVEALFSEFWDVEYFGTYKIATNKAYDVTYLLYQCGTEVPAEENDGRHEAILEIPLKEIAITVTPMITYMEQLGLEGTITTFLSDISTVASPCFAEAIQLGNITSLNRGDENTSPSLEGQDAPLLTTNTSSPLVTFISGYEQSVPSARPPFAETVVAVADSSEKTNNAIFEWVKFFSVFFNAEKIANEVFEAAQSRFDCVSENAGKTVTDAVDKPKLLWGKPSRRYTIVCVYPMLVACTHLSLTCLAVPRSLLQSLLWRLGRG